MTISPERFAAYLKIRADGAGPSSALERLRIHERGGPAIDPLPELPDGWKLTFSTPVDEGADLSWLGEMTNKPKGFAFRRGRPRGDGTYALDRGECAYFEPGSDPSEARAWYTAHGYGRHEAWLRSLEEARRSWKLWEEYACGERGVYGLVCKVYVHGHLMGEASLWGLDYDSVDDERVSVAVEAIDNAKENVASFCAKACPQRAHEGASP